MFYVIDAAEVSVSWDEKAEGGESFTTEKAAIRRAEALAKAEPGKTFYVAKAVKAVRCPVGSPAVKLV